jgi:phage major head subunit gpT-like protein
MLINAANLDLVYKGFKGVYSDAYLKAEVNWEKIAMAVASSGSEEAYGWIGQFPQLREWIGPRHVLGLRAHGFTIKNRKFESTVSVPRDNISDDKVGVFKPAFSEMGHLAKTHPEELIFALLAAGFDTTCFDGQNFFDTDHPVRDRNDVATAVSNMQAGSETPWFLLDTSRSVRPIIWQEREAYDFRAMTDPSNPHVFMNDEYIYGVRARVNAGFGLWQLAFASKGTLDVTNYAAAAQQ